MISTSTLLEAYRTGHFPMVVAGQIKWFSPDPRGILPLNRFRLSTRIRRVLRQGRFEIAVNRVFRDVIVACASRPDPVGNWIDDEMIKSYISLHEVGFAHSVEAWLDGVLVGGLYGVSLRGAFFGESMFHTATNASKVALCALVDRLRERRYLLLDIQWRTSHLDRFGAIDVPRCEYLSRLREAMKVDCAFE